MERRLEDKFGSKSKMEERYSICEERKESHESCCVEVVKSRQGKQEKALAREVNEQVNERSGLIKNLGRIWNQKKVTDVAVVLMNTTREREWEGKRTLIRGQMRGW